jgi:hypothetical protein
MHNSGKYNPCFQKLQYLVKETMLKKKKNEKIIHGLLNANESGTSGYNPSFLES